MAEEEAKKEKKAKSGNLVVIILIVLIVLLIGIFGLVAYLAFFSSDSSAEEGTDKQVVEEQQTDKKKPQTADSGEVGVIFPLDAFTANLLSENGSRYLKCTMELEQNIPTLTPELEGKKGKIRDIIIGVLSSKTYEEISTTKGKQRLKDEIKDKINAILNDGFIKNIYFTDFVIS